MWAVLKRLALGVGLMALASAVLLFSDAGRRRDSTARKLVRVALIQHASQPIIDEGVAGMLDALAASGFVDGQTMTVRRFNAEGDIATANTIAKAVADGGYDLLLTATTPSLQTVANANRAGTTKHVFALVTDPVVAGVGITGPKADQHPPWLVGYGTMQPVREAFVLARQLFPGLTRVGELWNPAEANSEAQTKVARQVCKELGIELIEANAENSSAVLEAAGSLVARDVQAIWVPGDITVLTAVESVVAAGRRGGIPVFTSIPGNTAKGALFDIGANYHEVGLIAGTLAAKVLNGADPRTIGVENVMPERITLNPAALAGLHDTWRIPPEVAARAGKTPAVDSKAKDTAALVPGRTYRIGVASFAPDPGADICLQGFLDGLAQHGLVEGRNLEVQRAHAQGEIANISPILQNFDGAGLDLIVPLTTPVLTAACSAVRRTPVVFTYVYDPVAAGAGTSFTEHLPLVTGVGSFPPVGDTVALIQRLVPGVKKVGTLYNAAEANSRKVVEVARGEFRRAGIELEEVTVAGSSEVFQAAQALVARGVQAFWITGDNTAILGFDGIVKVARDARLPLINNDPEMVPRGSLACVGIGFYSSGRAAAEKAAQVLAGTPPGNLPLENVAVKTVVLNVDAARALGVEFPADVLKEADEILDSTGALARKPKDAGRAVPSALAPAAGGAPAPRAAAVTAPKRTRPARLDLLEYVDVLDVEDAQRGIRAGLEEAGLLEGRDFVLTVRNAQGDMPTLSALVDAALTDQTEMLLTLSTPTLQAAIQRARNVPIVFTFVADGVAAGAGKSNEDHLPNVTGVPTKAAYGDLLALIRACLPHAKRLGTLFAPAEVNSEYSKGQVERLAPQYGFELIAVPVNSTAEASDAVLSLLSNGVDAIAQVPGNLTSAAFASITQPAERAGVPVFGFLSSDFANGAVMVTARDYFDGGRAAGHMAARILAGESPADIPFELLTQAKLLLNLDVARRLRLQVPESVVQKAAKVVGR